MTVSVLRGGRGKPSIGFNGTWLDEATANLDFRTEAAVKVAIGALAKGRTTLLIAHRASMVTDADRVIVLRDGVIAQDGTPAELIAHDGYFRDLVRGTTGRDA